MLFLSIAPAPYHRDISVLVDALSEPGPVLLSELYAAATQNDEYVAVTNAGTVPVSLSNWSISDGEGSMVFMHDLLLAPGCSFVASMNQSSYQSAFGRPPDWSPTAPDSSLISVVGSFRLANGGDSLSLVSSTGHVVDYVAYGDCSEDSDAWSGPSVPTPRSGEVLKRIRDPSGFRDSDSRSDWLPFREFRYGYTQTDQICRGLPAGAAIAFVSPDCSIDIVLDAISSSRRTVRLCSYELDSAPVCNALLEAASRGVAVQILVDGAPVGGISGRETTCLSVLRGSGASVRLVNGNLSNGVVQHVGALHAKYLTIDSARSVILSENFVEDGVPSDRLCGNRGWGMRLDDSGVALYLEALFDSDSRPSRPDVLDWADDRRFDPSTPLPEPLPANHTIAAMPPLVSTCDSKVTLVVSPDGSVLHPFLVDWVARADTLLIEQFQADLLWESRWGGSAKTSPLVEAVETVMGKGARVRMLLDSAWFNVEKNTEVAEYLHVASSRAAGTSGFMLLDGRNPMSLLHNKGCVFDGTTSMVSSNNWVYSSFAKNRELAAFLESEEIARYFSRSFEFDWAPDTTPPDASAGEDMRVPLGQKVRLSASDSVDDRAVAHWYWEVGADGVADGRSETFEFYPSRPGDVVVNLMVEDGWGNMASDSVVVTVYDPMSSGTRPLGDPVAPLHILAMVCAAAGASAGCALARWRLRSFRKINQLKPD